VTFRDQLSLPFGRGREADRSSVQIRRRPRWGERGRGVPSSPPHVGDLSQNGERGPTEALEEKSVRTNVRNLGTVRTEGTPSQNVSFKESGLGATWEKVNGLPAETQKELS